MEAEEEERSPSPRVVALAEHHDREPPSGFPDHRAESTWCALTAGWHPAVLAAVDGVPQVEPADYPPPPEPGLILLVPEGAGPRLPADSRTAAAEAGAIVIDVSVDRRAVIRSVLDALGLGGDFERPADDFLALGAAHALLRQLTTAMGHADCLDHDHFAREAKGAARAWIDGDEAATSGHLRAAFELLTQARERFYPVDAFIVDLCLLDKSLPAEALVGALATRTPITFLATAESVESLAGRGPEQMAALRQAVADGWADVAGGTYAESDEPLLPFTSILWQYLHGGEVYRRHLDERNVETLATRRFALYPHRPQVARRFGFRFGVHLGLDAGKFPIPPESKRLWEGMDSSHVESLMRPPMSADRASEGLRLAWRLGRSMKDDHVATVPLVHWPEPVATWYRDLRRVESYSPVLARCVTLGDYFHMSDRPWEMYSPKIDEYETPYLTQAVARGDADPISRRAAHARLRSELDALATLDALGRALTHSAPPEAREWESRGPLGSSDLAFPDLEAALETGRPEEARGPIRDALSDPADRLARSIVGDQGGDRGFLVLNPTGVARMAAVTLPTDRLPDVVGPLRAAQMVSGTCRAIVELPPFGYAWVPERQGTPSVQPRSTVSVEGRTLRNGLLEVQIDEATGGIRSIRAEGERVARIGQQIVIEGLTADGRPVATRMEVESILPEHEGQALACLVSRGRIVHPEGGRILARFRQEASLGAGRRAVDLRIDLLDLDEDWLSSIAGADPWASNLSCRWAWADPGSTLRRTTILSAVTTRADRPETPDALEISARNLRTTLLFGGLAHHRRRGERMLDTLLIVGRESARSFELSVALDLDHAHQGATEFLAPAPVVSVAGGPRSGPAGWLAHVEARGVHVPRLEFLERTGDGRGWGLAAVLMETTGHPARTRLRLFRNPIAARLTDFSGELILDLPIDGDAVPIDLTPREMARIEVRLG